MPSFQTLSIHNVFHTSLLRIHIANNGRLFPGPSEEQAPDLGGNGKKCHREGSDLSGIPLGRDI